MSSGPRLAYGALALSAVGFVVAAIGMTQALTAASTVPASRAGAGSGAVGNFTNSSFDFALNDAYPQRLDAVTFTQAPTTAGMVKIEWNGTAYPCTNAAGSVSCTTTSPQVTVTVANPTLRSVGVS